MSTIHDIEVTTIDGKKQKLSAYAGKTLLVVNVASKCGFTPQYKGLEALYRKYEDRGFVVLGFPCDQFGHQEPGDEEEIRSFCSLKYDVTFPMFAKVKTKGEGKSPAYQFLTAKNGEPRWNFHKYLVGKDGQVIRAFADKVQPDDPELRAAIEAALK